MRDRVGVDDQAGVAVPAAYELDDVTFAILWGASDYDDALQANGQAIHETRTALTTLSNCPRPRSAARPAAVPGLDRTGAVLQVQEHCRVPGASLSYADILSLAKGITAARVDGIVVTQGTDTIEETS